jgi:hypothetical protein
MLSHDTSPHPDRPREQRPRSICHHQLVPEQERRRRPDENLPNPAAIAASPLHPEPRHLAAGDPDHPRNAPGWRLTHRPRASTTATSTTIPITINAGHGKQRDHHAPQCPARPRNAASPGPGEAERQPRGACRGRDRQIRARKPACPGPPEPRPVTGKPVRGIMLSVRACAEISGHHPGPSCPRPWPHPHERSVTGRPAAPRLTECPRYERPRTQ